MGNANNIAFWSVVAIGIVGASTISLNDVASTSPVAKATGWGSEVSIKVDESYLPNLQSDTWASRNSEWIIYGVKEDANPNFHLGIVGGVNQKIVSVRRNLENWSEFEGTSLTMANKYSNLETFHGEFQLLAFTVHNADFDKYCFGFQHVTAERLSIEGFMCAAMSNMPDNEVLSCLLGSLEAHNYDLSANGNPEGCTGRTVFPQNSLERGRVL